MRTYKNSILAVKGESVAEYTATKYAGRYYARVLYKNSMSGFDCGNRNGYKTERGALNACKNDANARGYEIIEA